MPHDKQVAMLAAAALVAVAVAVPEAQARRKRKGKPAPAAASEREPNEAAAPLYALGKRAYRESRGSFGEAVGLLARRVHDAHPQQVVTARSAVACSAVSLGSWPSSSQTTTSTVRP